MVHCIACTLLLTLILVWPKLVHRLNKQNPINAEQLHSLLYPFQASIEHGKQ
ncbi:hypothetical protein Lste_3131 [Legionella steelei]|uniref:Uncharacterized protein n=1 Tax=Legionella steelei TaxID=947033 RepID=A0A0W0ZCQ3_9GAMM|nr:hypothetical protein Lste_3131 [Legionella steelei]